MRAPPCRTHSIAAAWRCPACERDLCNRCVATLPAGRGELAICVACGGMVELLTAPRAEVLPFSAAWLASLRQVFSPGALALIALFSCAIEFVLRTGSRTGWLGLLLEASWVLVVLRRAAGGRAPFGLPHWDDLDTALVGALPKLLVSAGFLAAAGWALQGSPAVWLVVALSAVLFPPALLFANIEGEGARWLTPWNLPAAARSIGGDLWPLRILAALWAGLTVVRSMQETLDLHDTHIGDKIAAGAGIHFLALAALAALACVAGQLLLTRAEELGHGEPALWRVPLSPDAVPAGRRAAPLPEPVPAQVAPIELDDPGDEGVVKAAQRFAAQGRDADAAEMLRGLLQRAPGAAVAPRAMVILARLYAERLGNAGEAQSLYLAVVERFPDTAAARFAQAQLVS